MKKRFHYLALLLLLAVGLRWVHFSHFPPGLWYDEAYTLAHAQELAQGGEFRLYYPEKHGEPAIFWLSALALKLGAGHLAPRWVVSLASVVSVLLLFFAVRDIFAMPGGPREFAGPSLDPDALALLSALLLAINYTYLFYSRMGWETLLVALLAIPALWLTWRGLHTGRWRDFALAGAAAGLSQYTSVNARVLPLAALLMLVGFLPRRESRRLLFSRWKGLLLMGLVALLVFIPLAITFARHPDWFSRRMQTAVGGPTALFASIWRTLAGWLWLGGAGIHSLPGRPIYDPVMGTIFLMGLGLAASKLTRPRYNLWLAWWLGMAAGGFLSSPAPIFYRLLAAIPATSVLCALGMQGVWAWLVRRRAAHTDTVDRTRFYLASLVLAALVLVSFGATLYDYFVRWANWERLPYVMDVGKWRAAKEILQLPPEEEVFVTIPPYLEPAITYAIRARAPRPTAFDGQRCLLYPAATERPAHYVVIQGYEHRSLARLARLAPGGQRVAPAIGGGAPYFVRYTLPAGAETRVPGKLPAPIHYDGLVLVGAEPSATTLYPGQPLTVTLTWEAQQAVDAEYTAFVHLLDPAATAAEALLLTQHDGVPCAGTAPTSQWQPGYYVLDEHRLSIPLDAPPGTYALGAGLYDAATLVRLPHDSQNVVWDVPVIGEITVLQPAP